MKELHKVGMSSSQLKLFHEHDNCMIIARLQIENLELRKRIEEMEKNMGKVMQDESNVGS